MKFAEVAVGQKFKFNNIEYTKTDEIKVSCCKRLNAVNNADQNKIMVSPNQEVELVTE